MFSKTLIAAVAATFIASTSAHMAIQEPPPIPGSDSKSPLDPSGDNFPCQGASLSGGTVTNLQVGQTQSLQFNLGGGANTAVHGGGSCQVSISYETDATALKDPSNWKVIHSYIGGCPTEAMGNLDNSVACTGGDDSACVDQSFGFDVPSEVKDGSAILAWTWFNNIGNREMYMNCAQVSISGGSNQLDTLPAMFTANIGNGCSTTEQFNTDFPNPGKYVTKSALNYPLKAPQGSCGSGPGSANAPSTPSTGGSTGGSSGGSSGSTPTTGSTGSKTTGGSKASKAPKNPGVFAEGQATTLATSVAAASTPVVAPPAASAPAPVTPANGSTGGSTGGSIGQCASGQVACSTPGFYCISSSQFGMCAWGCATPMAVAAGTSCSGGAIVAAKKEKRHLHIRHSRRGLMALSH